ncbi:MAG: hypothetical protein IT267_02885 [Saprospiraceae bacterium]|nr:hypothetical protein [Saprospiraceae bacterium]
MRNYSILIFLSFIVSCSPRLAYLNEELINDHHWTTEDLKKIQFYLSDDIVLTRQLNSTESNIQQGKIEIKNGSKLEHIVFKKGTPGILIFSPKDKRYAINFDHSAPDKYLIFGSNPKMNNRYVLMAKDWNRYNGTVSYNGQTYETSSHSAFTALMVNLKRSRNVDQNTEIAKGNKM